MRMATAFLLLSTCRGLLYIFGAFSQTQKVSFERRSLSVSFTGLLVSFTTRISIVVTLKKHCIDSLIHSFMFFIIDKFVVFVEEASPRRKEKKKGKENFLLLLIWRKKKKKELLFR